MQNLEQLIGTIRPLDRAAMDAAARRQAQLAKPPGSLGRLEELSIQLAGITGQLHNDLAKKQLLVFAADTAGKEYRCHIPYHRKDLSAIREL